MKISCANCLEVNYICQMLVLYMWLAPIQQGFGKASLLSESPELGISGVVVGFGPQDSKGGAHLGCLLRSASCRNILLVAAGSRMFLCDFGANSGDCHPDDPVRGPDCVGPGAYVENQ